MKSMMLKRLLSFIVLIAILSFYCLAPLSVDATPRHSRVVTDAVDVLSKYFIKAVAKIHEPLGRTALIITVSDALDPDIKEYLYNRLQEKLPKTYNIEIVNCLQCQTVRAYSDGNRIVIEKGLTKKRFAKMLARQYSLDTFLVVNVGYTGTKLYMQFKAVDTAKMDIVYQKTFKTHARFLTDKSFIFSLDIGPAYVISADADEDKFGAAIAVFFGERFYGLGKVGFGASTVFSVSNISFNQSSGPYISANFNEIAGMHWSFGELNVFINPGYAVSQKSIGLLMRGGFVFEMGNFTHVTAEVQAPLYSQNPNKKYPTSVLISFGFDLF